MKNFILKSTYIFFVAALVSCSSSDEPSTMDDEMNSLELGQAQLQVSGDLDTNIDGEAFFDSTNKTTVNANSENERVFRGLKYQITNSSGETSYVDVYWPEEDGLEMPDGEYPIKISNIFDFPTEKFVYINVGINGDSFDTVTGTQGTVNITKLNDDYDSYMVFSVEGLEANSNGNSITLEGSAKFINN